jgi:hypothetical protein
MFDLVAARYSEQRAAQHSLSSFVKAFSFSARSEVALTLALNL